MLYVGVDQHARHLNFCGCDEQGGIVLQRQVSTKWEEVDRFLEGLKARSAEHGGYVVIVEVCGFNGWLVERLKQHGCVRTYVIAAPPRSRQKTDRRDANKLRELLWLNRDRIARGERLIHVHEVYQATEQETYDRQLTHLRCRLGRQQTRCKNSIKGILRRQNKQQECPTKGGFTQAAFAWLKKVELPTMDRGELTLRVSQYELYAQQIQQVDALIVQRARQNRRVNLLRTLPKIGPYTALALSAHIGPMERFASGRSLANFFGITPGCRNSGESDRPGGITKAGHPLVRFLLGQMVLHALRNDAGLRQWYQRIKRRRGCKIARVAVMRRLCVSIWHMLTRQEAYRPVGHRAQEDKHVVSAQRV